MMSIGDLRIDPKRNVAQHLKSEEDRKGRVVDNNRTPSPYVDVVKSTGSIAETIASLRRFQTGNQMRVQITISTQGIGHGAETDGIVWVKLMKHRY